MSTDIPSDEPACWFAIQTGKECAKAIFAMRNVQGNISLSEDELGELFSYVAQSAVEAVHKTARDMMSGDASAVVNTLLALK